jgi:hypothetical protein
LFSFLKAFPLEDSVLPLWDFDLVDALTILTIILKLSIYFVSAFLKHSPGLSEQNLLEVEDFD